MQRLRRFGFFALVAVALAGCGTVATTLLTNSKPARFACSPTPPISLTTFCVTPQEQALGQVPVHMRTVPDSFFLDGGIELSIAPGDEPVISKATAETIVLAGLHRRNPSVKVIVNRPGNPGGSIPWK